MEIWIQELSRRFFVLCHPSISTKGGNFDPFTSTWVDAGYLLYLIGQTGQILKNG